jgi:DNA-binding transcriptional ArsR family regulator
MQEMRCGADKQSPARYREPLVRKHDADAKQIAALVNPRRTEIYQMLSALGPLSVGDLAERLSLRPTALYHHLNLLVSVGVLSRIDRGQGGGRGRPAVIYEARKRMHLARAFGETKTRRIVEKIIRATAVTAVRDLNRALAGSRKTLSGPQKDVAHFRALFVASEKDLARVNALFDELQQIVFASPRRARKGKLLTITWFVSPPQRRSTRTRNNIRHGRSARSEA